MTIEVPKLSPRPALVGPRKFMLLASYCGGETPDCSDDAPCQACLDMCNIFGEAGEYLGVLPDFRKPKRRPRKKKDGDT